MRQRSGAALQALDGAFKGFLDGVGAGSFAPLFQRIECWHSRLAIAAQLRSDRDLAPLADRRLAIAEVFHGLRNAAADRRFRQRAVLQNTLRRDEDFTLIFETFHFLAKPTHGIPPRLSVTDFLPMRTSSRIDTTTPRSRTAEISMGQKTKPSAGLPRGWTSVLLLRTRR